MLSYRNTAVLLYRQGRRTHRWNTMCPKGSQLAEMVSRPIRIGARMEDRAKTLARRGSHAFVGNGLPGTTTLSRP
jgi:hypothetical protein